MPAEPAESELVDVTEGRTRLVVPGGNKARGPGRKPESGVFFNPAMAFSRDLSVVLLDALAPAEGWHCLDGLAGTGARAVRFATEVPRLRVEANDWNPRSLKLAEENAARNGVQIETTRRNLGALLWEGSWNYVDIDPFGSPAVFVDAATRAVRNQGLLAVTATDATALFGVYPDVCRRRYLATPQRSELGHELALRILAGFVLRQGLKHDIAFTPVLSHASDHFYRVYLRARRGAGRANAALDAVGYAFLCPACGERGLTPDAPRACPACAADAPRVAGPLWTGPLHDADVTRAVLDALPAHEAGLARGPAVRAFVEMADAEAGLPPLFHNLHFAAARARVEAPPRAAVTDALRARGFAAGRAHVDPVALRTDAPVAELDRVIRELAES